MKEKRSIKTYITSIAKDLIWGKASGDGEDINTDLATLDDLKLDALKREMVRLDQEQRKTLGRLRDIEGKKRQLFEEGVRNSSEREAKVTARRIKELDVRANNMDKMLQAISKQVRILNGLIQVKDRHRVMSETGISKLLSDIDLGDLINYIDTASVDGEFHLNKFDELLGVLEESDSLSPEYNEDQDVTEILKAMQEAREFAEDPVRLNKKFDQLSLNQHEEQRNFDENDGEGALAGEF